MIATIHQPEYLPWLGFFDRLLRSDVFVVLDDVNYQKNGFINRNRIKTKDGWQWLTVPVKDRSSNKKINEVLIDNEKKWQESQLSVIKNNYSDSLNFKTYYNFLKETFNKNWKSISDLDVYLIKSIVGFLGLKTEIKKASLLNIDGIKTERLINICKKIGADTYFSGPGGKNYIDLDLFEKESIKVVFQEFLHPEYSQIFKEQGFLKEMSVIDLLFNCGFQDLEIIKLGSKKKI